MLLSSVFSVWIANGSLYSPIFVVKQIHPSCFSPGRIPIPSIPYCSLTVVPENFSVPGTTRLLEEVIYPLIFSLSSVPKYSSPLYTSPAFSVTSILSCEKRSCGCSCLNFPLNSSSIVFFKIVHLISLLKLLSCCSLYDQYIVILKMMYQ